MTHTAKLKPKYKHAPLLCLACTRGSHTAPVNSKCLDAWLARDPMHGVSLPSPRPRAVRAAWLPPAPASAACASVPPALLSS